MKKVTIITSIILLVPFQLLPQPRDFPMLKGLYLGQDPPGMTARLFAAGVVSTWYFEHSSPVFTPDLTEIYWSTIYEQDGKDTERPIVFMKMVNGVWSRPGVPVFARNFGSSESPFISPDGKRLFFHASPSLRPETADIYYVDRTGNDWSEPVKIEGVVNQSGWNGQPTVSSRGTIYFLSESQKQVGLFYARLTGGKYGEPVYMEDQFNSRQTDWTPYVAPDESYFIFCSFREGGFGSGDLYISFKQKDGTWGQVRNMGEKINTDANERFPNVSPDGRYLFFNSTRKIPGAGPESPGNGNGDVYWIDAGIIDMLR